MHRRIASLCILTYEGKRLQKFVYRGLAPIPAGEQGPLWPERAAGI